MIDVLAMSRTYGARLRQLLRPAEHLAKRVEGEQLDLFAPTWQARLRRITDELATIISPEAAAAEAWRQTTQLDRVQMASWRRIAERAGIEAVQGATEQAVLIERARVQARLILSIPEQLAEQVSDEVYAAFERGAPTADLARVIQERTGVARSRANLIARDQLGTLNAELTKTRQQAAGVTRYEWSSSRDERVRASHANLDGQVFSWDAPPPIGHPGEPINCRCIALPIIDLDE